MNYHILRRMTWQEIHDRCLDETVTHYLHLLMVDSKEKAEQYLLTHPDCIMRPAGKYRG